MENKTAVQWLYEAYRKEAIPTDAILELFKKAEEMEKEQIETAFDKGMDNSLLYWCAKTKEEYYNETFKSE
jgi:hypothetical protein